MGAWEFITKTRLGIALVGLVAVIAVGLLQELRVAWYKADATLADARWQQEQATARGLRLDVRTAVVANQGLQQRIAAQNQQIAALAAARDQATKEAAAAVVAEIKRREATRRQRPPGTGPAYMQARLTEIVK